MTTVIENHNHCPLCKSNIMLINGQNTCQNCGLVTGYTLVTDQWFTPKKPFIPKRKTNNYKKTIQRLKYYRHFVTNTNDYTFTVYSGKLAQIARTLNLSEAVINRTIYLFKDLRKKRELLDPKPEYKPFMVLCLLKTIREQHAGIRLFEIFRTFECFYPAKNKTGRGNNLRQNTTKLRYILLKEFDFQIPKATMNTYFSRIISIIIQSPDIINKIEQTTISPFEYQKRIINECTISSNKISKLTLKGFDPYLLATAIVYLADKKISKEILGKEYNKNKGMIFLKPLGELTNCTYSQIARIARYLKPLIVNQQGNYWRKEE